MCCPHHSPLPPFWRRYVTLTHCFLYLFFNSSGRMWMLGFLVGWWLVAFDIMYCLHFSYLLVHLTKLLATVWTRLPDSHLFSVLSRIPLLSLLFHYYYQQYHYYHYIVSLPLDQLLLSWRLGVSNQAEVYLDCSFCPSIFCSMMV